MCLEKRGARPPLSSPSVGPPPGRLGTHPMCSSLITLPTHLLNPPPGSLVPVLSPPLSPAAACLQAQELGEQARFRDDALWALDGLAASSANTRRDSLAALAEIAAGRRGRLALRSGGLAASLLEAAGGRRGAFCLLCSVLGWMFAAAAGDLTPPPATRASLRA